MLAAHTWLFAWGVPLGATANLSKYNLMDCAQLEMYLLRDTLFYTFTEIEAWVSVAGIRGDIEFIHLDKVESITVAIACTSFENPLFHGKGNRIVAEDEELWIVHEYLIVKLFLGGKKDIN